jgi:hypothetical protein
MKKLLTLSVSIFFIMSFFSCKKEKDPIIIYTMHVTPLDEEGQCNQFDYTNQEGCDGKVYPNPFYSKYVLPYPPDSVYVTGLTNCSDSYHAPGLPDRYAFDFDMHDGTNFYASRGGEVVYVENSQPSTGGGGGNACIIDHHDDTFGIYLHSPENGIIVEVGQEVIQGELLGVTGHSGLAGYAHLHFIVVQDSFNWPYDPIPITFKNVFPSDVILESHKTYKACSY